MDFLFSIIGIYIVSFFADRSLSAKAYRGSVTDHFDGKVFFNYEDKEEKQVKKVSNGYGLLVLLRWMLQRSKSKKNWGKKKKQTAAISIPKEKIFGKELLVTFIGHSTFLIQTEGLNILTDPIWSKRASPFRFIGPKRFHENGLAMENLPPIDIVLVSHNHYDHMDIPSLKKIQEKWNPKIFVPLGNKKYLESRGLTNSEEMDWWDEKKISERVRIVCVPAHHFAARGFSDRDKTLWSGFVLETPSGGIYFAGDTGEGKFAKKIQAHYPDGFRLALLPIGAFKPEWFMGQIHMSPDQAFAMHSFLKVKTSIGMHFGTFNLADDGEFEAPERIRELTEHREENQKFITLERGETATID